MMDARPYTYASSVGSRVSCVSIPSTLCGVWRPRFGAPCSLNLNRAHSRAEPPRFSSIAFSICYTIPDETRRAQSHNNAHKFINAVMHTSNLATSRYTAGSGTVARQDCTVQALDADELSQPLARILARFQR